MQNWEQELWSAILGEGAKFAENVLVPLNQSGDEEGCTWNDGVVTTPAGFKEAYQQYAEAGWQSMSAPAEYGGQDLPFIVNNSLFEIRGAANWSWTGFIGFGLAGAETLTAAGSDELQKTFLPKIYTGEWLGTMCLTESHCGTDLGLMRTKAEPNEDRYLQHYWYQNLYYRR